MFPSAENRPSCGDEIGQRIKLHAKLCHCLSDLLSSQKRKESDLVFTNLGYQSPFSENVPKSEKKRRRKKFQVEKASARIF